ncbi:GNAT family N-acetyltransferase [Butyrivibrio sp. FC2001]|uniref:GNAT family N-acetyltransferase n=1 Tax=Butyrivibrio sp. FC2001 TaxID=1280671 RepID=UPI0004793ED4|nr:GNAT family N-acetyltransferase [Butyrivibrio sp. FC2001]
MNILVRNVEKADYQSVRRIMNQVQEMHVAWRPDIYKSNENLISEDVFDLMINSGNAFVADVDGVVAGVLEVTYKHIESPAHVTREVVFIDTMAVDKEYRGRGIGHQFFEKVRELKDSSGSDGIELQVNAMNHAAYEMYKECGFTEKSINMELL